KTARVAASPEIQSGVSIRRLRLPRCSSVFCTELTDDRTTLVGEDHRRTSLDHSRGACSHNVGAKIEFAPRDPDDGDQQRGDEPNHHDLEVGGSVCSVQRPVHSILSVAAPLCCRSLNCCFSISVCSAALARCRSASKSSSVVLVWKKFCSVAAGKAGMNWAMVSPDAIRAARPTMPFVATFIFRLPIPVGGKRKMVNRDRSIVGREEPSIGRDWGPYTNV